MTSLIKQAAAQARARPIDRLAWRTSEDESKAARVKDPMIADLEAQVSDLKHKLADAATAYEKAVVEAYENGKTDAEIDHERQELQALALLKGNVEKAADEARVRFRKLDALALLLCEIGLEKLFADEPRYSSMVTRALRQHLNALRPELVLHVQVSAEDFSDAAALAALADELGAGQFEIRQDASLKGGACGIALRLGRIDISLPEHWDELKAELQRLATAEPVS